MPIKKTSINNIDIAIFSTLKENIKKEINAG